MKKSTHKKLIERLQNHIDEGNDFFSYAYKDSFGNEYLKQEVRTEIVSWQLRVKNSIKLIFGLKSSQFDYIQNQTKTSITTLHDLKVYIGILDGALKDLADGFIDDLEFLLSGDLYDSLIEEARHLNNLDYKDPSAVLGRIVLEKTLKKLAIKNSLSQEQKASKINDELKSLGFYSKSQWRRIQAMLDVGNDAAHGKFDQYDKNDVSKMLEDIERFVIQYLTSDI